MTVLVAEAAVVDANEGYEALMVHASIDRDRCTLNLAGELDGSSSGQLLRAATGVRQSGVVIDMGLVSFMDCSGYGSLMAALRMFDLRGQTVVIQGLTGQPTRLLDLITQLG